MNIPATIASLFILIGRFLPWIQMGALLNNRGINNPDGMIVLAVGIVGLIISIGMKKKWAIIKLLVEAVCGIVGVIDYQEVSQRVESMGSQDNIFSISVTVGAGLYLVLIGSGLLIIISIIDGFSGSGKKKVVMNAPQTGKEVITQSKSEISLSIADELKKYKDLLDTGAITQEEYESIKSKLLS